MTAADIQRIEQALSVKLPADYQHLLVNHPFPDGSSAAACMVIRNAEVLIHVNKNRSLHFRIMNLQRAGKRVPQPHHFLIGSDGGDEQYYLDLLDPGCAVVRFDLETGSMSPYAQGMAEYLAKIEQVDRELAEDGQRAAARREAVASDNRVPEMKVFQVHLRTGRMVHVCAGGYRQEGVEHVFYGSARILEPPRRGMPVRVESREERMERLQARPAPDAVVVFAGTDVESVVELPPPPPPVYAPVADAPP
jgi:hypothetical protein